MPLKRASDFVAFLPYEDGRFLEKSNVKIDPDNEGKGSIELSQFELQGLKVGKSETFTLKFKIDGEIKNVVFYRALDIRVNDEGRKFINEA